MKNYFYLYLLILVTISLSISSTTANNSNVVDKSSKNKIKRSIDYLLNDYYKSKRSPFLRIDELQNRIYSKNKLGGGVIDPLSLGKRGSSNDGDLLAQVIFNALEICLKNEKCINRLRFLIKKDDDDADEYNY